MGRLLVLGLSLAVAGGLSTACGDPASTDGDGPDRAVVFEPGGARLSVRLADTDDERRVGLMGVRDLPADEGMAFVWDDVVETTFWMKDTLIPLSIAFVDPDGRIVTIADMQPCERDPCPTYAADAPFAIAIEANLGWFAREGVDVGDRATLGALDG
jgi:uncharacterized protein